MKISFLEPHLLMYGGIRRIIELANRLMERDHDVTIFHSDGSSCKWMRCVATIKPSHEILNEGHDVVIYNDPNPTDYKFVKKAKARLKVYYVLGLYDKSLLTGLKLKIYDPWYKRPLYLKKSLRSPYLKLSNATWLKEWLEKNMKIDSTLLMGGINREMFFPVEVKKNREEICILSSGDPRDGKGTQTVLDAFEIVREEESEVVLDTYHGKGISQDKMAEKFCKADVFVDAQEHGGWNNPVAEAMACKVPVVCTDIGGVADFAFHEKTALLVPSKNPKAMASSIIRIIRDEVLRNRIRENAYQHIIKFSWDKSAERLDNILSTELNKQS